MKKRFALKLIAACAITAGATACFARDFSKIEVKNGKQEVVSILPALAGSTAAKK